MTQLTTEIDGNTAIISINNPPANTWNEDELNELKNQIIELNENTDIYALIITGKGDKFFSAGADLQLFANGDKEIALSMALAFGEAFEALTHFRGVSIAAINGYAMGGGLEIALACDVRISETQAIMAMPEGSVGLLPCAGGTQNLTALVGEGWAKRIILCGEKINADKALQLGLVEEVVDMGMALQSALLLAKKVANQSPSSVLRCKKLIQAGREMPRAQALPLEREYFLQLFSTEDQQEGVNAFLEKRKPQWKNS